MTNFFNKLWLNIKENFTTKRFGFYVGLAAFILMIALLIVYSGIDKTLFNSNVILFVVLGIVLYIVLSVFKQTALLAQVSLMVFSFLSFCAFASTDGMVDYLSTQFFDGISFAKLMSLDSNFLFSALLMLLTFIVASVAMYMPQNKKLIESK